MYVQVEDQSPVEDLRLQSEIAEVVQIRSKEKLQPPFNCNAINCKQSYNHHSIVTPLIANTNLQCQQKFEETKSITKQSMSENKFLRDK